MLQLKRLLCIVVGLAVTSVAMAGPAMLWNNGPNVKPTSSQAQIYNNSGTVSLPSYSFGSQTTTGLSLPSANNLAMSVAGNQYFNLDSGGVFKFGSPTASARLSLKSIDTSGMTAIAIERSDTTAKTYLAKIAGDDIVIWDGSDIYYAAAGLLSWTGPSAGKYKFEANSATAVTAASSFGASTGYPSLMARNNNNTNGNYEVVGGAEASGNPVAAWYFYNDAHSATVQTGHLEAATWNAGVYNTRITVSATGVDIKNNLQVRGLNVPALLQSDASGNITTTALTNGQLHIGSTGAAPVAATLTAGAGISITNGAGTISIAASGVPAANRLTKTADYTLASTDNSIWCDASSNNVRLTLPSSTSAGSGARYRITKVDSSAHVCSVVSAGASDVFYMFGTSLSDASISITDPGTSAEFEANGGTAYATE